ncbi:type II toxin-antitoxin system VapC family toxin [Planococcus lenghuensis]|uniref:PIN domain-containing protein n=1 Tax=Planococcus lenghuensis TaxID=2213202 RepID=A0A1Q2L191_9BACL|nr:PIN domain-containing protein [Planococcus lenghuensis]AQQ54183.1 hypothetical protein B0X71_14430 [Planococcus lenghuensis]
MTRYLIDTNIIRFYIQQQRDVERFLDNCMANEDTLLLSMVTVGELRSQAMEISERQRGAVRRLIKAFPKVEVTDPADRKAHAYRRMGRCIRELHKEEKKAFLPRLPGLADSKIAVDAINENAEIVTNNTRDFHISRFFGVSLYDPKENIRFPPIEKSGNSPSTWILPDERYR